MISVIVPIYGVERYLRRCVESLLAQTVKDIEVILVDDGSPDRSGEICDEFAGRDSRIRVIHQPNRGVSAARNAGLEAARGEFIGFVDPDDFIEPDMYESLLAALTETGADIAAAGYNYYDEKYNVDEKRIYPIRDNEMLDRKEIFKELQDMPPTFRHVIWSKLFRRELIGEIRFDEEARSSEDLGFLLDYLRKVRRGVFVHRPLYCNLVREGSATHGGLKAKSLRDSFRIHERMYLDTVREFPELRSYAIAYLMDVMVLKYKAAQGAGKEASKELREMRRMIRRYALRALVSRHIYWKTRISYLLV